MERELIRLDELFLGAVLDQSLVQLRAFAISVHTVGDVTAEEIEDHVPVEVRPFNLPELLGYIPAPQLLGSGGHHLGLLVGRIKQLIETSTGLATLFQ